MTSCHESVTLTTLVSMADSRRATVYERANEPGLRFEDALNDLKRRGRDINEVDDDRCVVTITKVGHRREVYR